jgi:hypothetical protein
MKTIRANISEFDATLPFIETDEIQIIFGDDDNEDEYFQSSTSAGSTTSPGNRE